MGGGVGKAISDIVSSSDTSVFHELILLEQPIHRNFLDVVLEAGIKAVIQPDQIELNKLIGKSDVTIIHWWHHPKTAKLLYDFPEVAARVVFWTHISHLTVPALAPQFLFKSSMVWFTTPASYETAMFRSLPTKVLGKKTGVVYGCAGFDHFPELKHKEHRGFTIGYLGYIDFSKLHPDFILFCKAVGIPEARFILAGEAPAQDILKKQAQEQNVKNEFVYPGYTTNIHEVLATFDVFGYPLMPFHTCTTENVILEAMAAKVPPVLLNQLSEKYIIKNGETGILVSNEAEYGNAIRYLYHNPDKRQRIGSKAREYVIKEYSRKNIINSFFKSIKIAMKQPKQKVSFREIMGATPAQWFTACLGPDEYRFRQSILAGVAGQTPDIKHSILHCSPLLKGANKASLFHYAREFSNDPMLQIWQNIIREESEKSD
jgi:glycosyltransferase involved in cell wall biosynthesis